MSSGGRVRRLLMILLKVGLSFGLLAWVLYRVNPDHLVARMLAVDPRWLGLAALTFAASNVLGALQWGRLLELSGVRLPLLKVLSFYWVGLFFSNVLPANVGGDVVRIVDVTRSTGSKRSAVGATLLDRIIGFVAISLLGVIALPMVPLSGTGMLLWLVVLLFSMVTVVLCLTVYRRGVLGFAERWVSRIEFLSFGRRYTALADELHSYRRHTGSLLVLVSLAFVIQVLRVLVHVMVARGLGMTLPAAWFFVIVPILAVVVVLPISIAGLGVRETAAVGLFGRVGVTPTVAVVHQLSTFFLTLAVNLIGGVLFIARSVRRPALGGAGDIS